jgi:hypothetical protein
LKEKESHFNGKTLKFTNEEINLLNEILKTVHPDNIKETKLLVNIKNILKTSQEK